MSAYMDHLAIGALGKLVITRHYPGPHDYGHGHITIERADPKVAIAHELLREIDRGSPFARIIKTCICSPRIGCGHFQGARLEICAENRRVIYVIGTFRAGDAPGAVWWPAEWPD